MTGLSDVTASVTGVERELFRDGLPGMWAMVGAHWIFMAFLSLGLSRYKSNSCAAAIYMIGAAGLLLLGSGLMLRKLVRADN